MPLGVIVNYLARRTNPTPYYLFDSTSEALWSEERMLAALRAQPPDWVAFVDRGEDRFGERAFREVYGWVKANYRAVWQIGTPFTKSGFSVMLLRRASPTAPAGG
jgi:hypothetical protein